MLIAILWRYGFLRPNSQQYHPGFLKIPVHENTQEEAVSDFIPVLHLHVVGSFGDIRSSHDSQIVSTRTCCKLLAYDDGMQLKRTLLILYTEWDSEIAVSGRDYNISGRGGLTLLVLMWYEVVLPALSPIWRHCPLCFSKWKWKWFWCCPHDKLRWVFNKRYAA